jgi:hypothetical protein
MSDTQRYRHDAEYRQRVIEHALRWQRKANQDPVYRRLTYIRKRIVDKRDSYQAWSARAEKTFRELQKLIAERDRLAAEYRARKKEQRKAC